VGSSERIERGGGSVYSGVQCGKARTERVLGLALGYGMGESCGRDGFRTDSAQSKAAGSRFGKAMPAGKGHDRRGKSPLPRRGERGVKCNVWLWMCEHDRPRSRLGVLDDVAVVLHV